MILVALGIITFPGHLRLVEHDTDNLGICLFQLLDSMQKRFFRRLSRLDNKHNRIRLGGNHNRIDNSHDRRSIENDNIKCFLDCFEHLSHFPGIEKFRGIGRNRAARDEPYPILHGFNDRIAKGDLTRQKGAEPAHIPDFEDLVHSRLS